MTFWLVKARKQVGPTFLESQARGGVMFFFRISLHSQVHGDGFDHIWYSTAYSGSLAATGDTGVQLHIATVDVSN